MLFYIVKRLERSMSKEDKLLRREVQKKQSQRHNKLKQRLSLRKQSIKKSATVTVQEKLVPDCYL